MNVNGKVAVLTGGASGLGLAAAEILASQGALPVIVDLPGRDAVLPPHVAKIARFVAADVTDEDAMNAALDQAAEIGAIRAVVHTAGRGAPRRIVDRNHQVAPLDVFEQVVRLNVIGSYNVLRLAAVRMSHNELLAGERGVVVLTASIAAYEGQIGQTAYAASKSGVVGMTLPAARDLALHAIRVCTIAPGLFETPLLAGMTAAAKESLSTAIPQPPRLGEPREFGLLVAEIIRNPYLNGETIRLDGALRLGPR
jgi:NAD(P)-dependent dehydrogenase (short-subunit alcohol dehydrogenase family)